MRQPPAGVGRGLLWCWVAQTSGLDAVVDEHLGGAVGEPRRRDGAVGDAPSVMAPSVTRPSVMAPSVTAPSVIIPSVIAPGVIDVADLGDVVGVLAA